MENSKLIRLLSTFSKGELRRLFEFTSSPYYNKQKDLIRLMRYLRDKGPKFSLRHIKKEIVFSKVFPSEKYNEKQLNYSMSFLLKLAEDFLITERFGSSENEKKFLLLSALLERKLFKSYQFIFNKNASNLERSTFQDTDFFYHKSRLYDLDNNHYMSTKIRKKDNRLMQAADAFDVYSLAKKLRFCCELFDRKKFLSVDEQLRLEQEISNYLKNRPKKSIPVLDGYFEVLQMFTKEDGHPHFLKLKEYLGQYENHFSEIEVKKMYGYAINYAIRHLNERQGEVLQELFNLYEMAIGKKISYENNFLSPWSFKNVIKVALRLGKFEWTEAFIEEKTEDLAPEFRRDALHYNLADLAYYKKDFGGALTHLQQVEFSDIFYALDSKKMMMKIYFEEEEEDALYAMISAFRMFLRRNKLVGAPIKEAYGEFINVVSLLLKRDKKSLGAAEQILATKKIPDHAWLNSKLGK